MSNTKRESSAAYRARMRAHGSKPMRKPPPVSALVMEPTGATPSMLRDVPDKTCKGCGFIVCAQRVACSPLTNWWTQPMTKGGIRIGIDLGFEKSPFSEASDRLRAMLTAPLPPPGEHGSAASAMPCFSSAGKPIEMPRFTREERWACEYQGEWHVHVPKSDQQPLKPEATRWKVGDKARCIADQHPTKLTRGLTLGVEYEVVGLNGDGRPRVVNDDGLPSHYTFDAFERVEDDLPPGWQRSAGQSEEYVYGGNRYEPSLPSVDKCDGWRAFSSAAAIVGSGFASRELAMAAALGIQMNAASALTVATVWTRTANGELASKTTLTDIDENKCARRALAEYHRQRGGR